MNKVPITVCLIALSMILSCALDDKRVCNPGEWGCLNNNFARCNDGAWDVEIYCAETEKCNSSTRTCDPLNNPDKLNCNDDEHIYENACEPNDIQNCGKHGTVCEVKNAKNSCTNGQCTFECNDGYHEYNNICELNEFITVWDLPDSDYEINFPLQDLESKVTIDWGDDNVDRDISPSTTYAKHIFSKKGKYTIKVRGKINQWSCKRASNESTFCDGLIKIQSYGETTFGSYAFYKATNLTSLPQGITPRFANQSMEGAFYGASSFNQDISFWDTSSITNMSKVFKNAFIFDQNISSWNTSNVTDMSEMFYGATEFNQPLNEWNTSNVTSMQKMFMGGGHQGNHYAPSSKFNQLIAQWDTSNVTDMSYMFKDNTSFNQPLNTWNTSHVKDMSFMFSNAIAFNHPLDNWDTSNVTNMNYMFNNTKLFNHPLNK